MSEIKAEVLALSEKLAAGITADATGVFTADALAYANNLPEGITKETLEALSEYNKQFIPAAAHAVGLKGIEVMSANKDLQDVSCFFPSVNKDGFDFKMNRETPGINGADPSYGSMRAKVVIHAAGNRGQYAKVKTLMSEKAAAAFGAKK